MEMQWPSFQVLLTLFVFLIFVLRIRKRGNPNLPPGPWKLPVIGNIHQLIGSLPHHGLRDLAKKYGPFMHLQLGEVSTIVVSSAEFAKEVMRTHDVIFASRPHLVSVSIITDGCIGISFAPYGNYWKQLRKITAQELFSTIRVQFYQPIRREEVMNLSKWINLRAGSPVNLTEEIYSVSYSIISRAAFGSKIKDEEKFISVVKQFIKAVGGFDLADVFPSVRLIHLVSGMKHKLERLRTEADQILENIIKDHTEATEAIQVRDGETEEDLVDVLLRYHNQTGGPEFSLTIDLIKTLILEVFSGGGETGATTVDWAMAEMMKNPRIMKAAQNEVREVFNSKGQVDETHIKEMKYLNMVVKETLRLHPAVPLLLPRECTEACEIRGYKIPAKTKVVVNAWAIGRDPDYWSEPESFYPERFLDSSVDFRGANFEYIPFGAGRRICPGMLFGLANVELQLASLLYYFDWKLPNGMKHQDMDMTELFGASVRRKQDLHLIPIPYQPLPTQNSK